MWGAFQKSYWIIKSIKPHLKVFTVSLLFFNKYKRQHLLMKEQPCRINSLYLAVTLDTCTLWGGSWLTHNYTYSLARDSYVCYNPHKITCTFKASLTNCAITYFTHILNILDKRISRTKLSMNFTKFVSSRRQQCNFRQDKPSRANR